MGGTVVSAGAAAVRVRVRVHPVPPPGPWTAQAGCAAPWVDPVLVFTAEQANDLDGTARAVCAACPVRGDCDRHASSVRGGSITAI